MSLKRVYVCICLLLIIVLAACTNASIEKPMPLEQPNLVVVRAHSSLKPPFPMCLSAAQRSIKGIIVTIRNDGNGDADTFVIKVNNLNQQVAGLKAGSDLDVWFDTNGQLWDSYFMSGFEVTVDSDAQIVERLESDNTFRGSVATLTAPSDCTATPRGN